MNPDSSNPNFPISITDQSLTPQSSLRSTQISYSPPASSKTFNFFKYLPFLTLQTSLEELFLLPEVLELPKLRRANLSTRNGSRQLQKNLGRLQIWVELFKLDPGNQRLRFYQCLLQSFKPTLR